MAVEIREVVLQARVKDEQPVKRNVGVEDCDLKADILAECKKLVNEALARRESR